MEPVKEVKINVAQEILDDLQKRLKRTRWPDELNDADWNYGTDLAYMKEFVDYWRHSYDWRKQEAAINTLAQFEAEIDGRKLYFIHERGKGPNPIPIILFHGWPDTIARYLKLIPMLTDPARFGGDPNQSFDVVVPSIFDTNEGGPEQQPFKHLAERSWRLMTEILGYPKFAAGGGDGGSVIAQSLAVDHPESIIGLHLTDIGYHAPMAQYDDLSETEQQYLAAQQQKGYAEGAYAMELGTKPQTFAVGLTDSPVGWAALVIEKLRTWSDCDGDVEKSFTKDELLTNIMLTWVNRGISSRGYREEFVSGSLEPGQAVEVPVALAIPPGDLDPVPPREFAQRSLKDIQRYTVLAHGGHFVAMENPELMAEDIRAFFYGQGR